MNGLSAYIEPLSAFDGYSYDAMVLNTKLSAQMIRDAIAHDRSMICLARNRLMRAMEQSALNNQDPNLLLAYKLTVLSTHKLVEASHEQYSFDSFRILLDNTKRALLFLSFMWDHYQNKEFAKAQLHHAYTISVKCLLCEKEKNTLAHCPPIQIPQYQNTPIPNPQKFLDITLFMRETHRSYTNILKKNYTYRPPPSKKTPFPLKALLLLTLSTFLFYYIIRRRKTPHRHQKTPSNTLTLDCTKHINKINLLK